MPPRQRVAEDVFSQLLEALLSDSYGPGDKLPPQRALAADLGVSMAPLREALERLTQMGLIDVRHGDAMRVRDWREHGGLDVIGHLMIRAAASGGLSVERGPLADIFEARGLMLTAIAGLAASRRDDEQAARLERLAGALANAADANVTQELDYTFFTELAHAAGNLVFVLILNAIRSLYFEQAELLPVTARHAELAPLYAQAAAAVRDGDAGAAAEAVGELAERQRERVGEALGG